MAKTTLTREAFIWHFGVVEDRQDPLELGRLRVRYYGYHTEDKSKVPTESLPWSTVLQKGSATSGVGSLPTYVEGTWVIGFFIDQKSYQRPFVIGSFAGIPTLPPDVSEGFFDPDGVYPKVDAANYNGLDESDLSRLARGENAELHESLIRRRSTLVADIPTAIAPHVTSVQKDHTGATYDSVLWTEPHPRGEANTTSTYPLNQVHESESGHIIEIDDTPGAERLNRQHTSGTYEEIIADGTKTTKVVGNEFELTIKDKKIFIGGSCDVTILGDAKMAVLGDYYQQVEGNYYLTVKKDKVEKIGGNHVTEITSDRALQINGNNMIRITKSNITSIQEGDTITVGGDRTETIVGDENKINANKLSLLVAGNSSHLTGGNFDFGASGNFNLAAAGKYNVISTGDMSIETSGAQITTVATDQTINVSGDQHITAVVTNINNDVEVTGTSTATVDHISGTISGKLHTHPISSGSSSPGPTGAPT